MILRNAVSSLISAELGGIQHFQNLGQEYFFTRADLVMLPAGGIVFNANGP